MESINVSELSSVTEILVAIVILCDDYSSMAGKTRTDKKAKRNSSDLACRWWESRGDRSIKDTVRIGTAYVPRRQRVEELTLD